MSWTPDGPDGEAVGVTAPVNAPEQPRQRSRVGFVLASLVTLGLVAMWAYVLYLAIGPGRQSSPDRLSDPDFAPAAQRVVVAPEAEISGPTFAGLAATSALLVVCGMMMFDLVRSMWGYNDPMLSGWLLESTKGLF